MLKYVSRNTRARLTTHDPPPTTHLPTRFSHPQKKRQFVTHISTHTYLADFLKTNLGKSAFMHLSEKGPKGRFFASDKLDNHTIEGKGKNKQIERAKRKKGGGKKKAMVAPIVLTFSTLAKKKCLAEEVYLAETFSKMHYGKKKMVPTTAIYLFITISA